METFLKALLDHAVSYQFPQIWKTKAETLRQFVDECKHFSSEHTSSCWQQNRQSSVGSTRRQPEVLHQEEAENSREERYANAFGRAFLTPARAVMQKFQEVTAGSNTLSRRHVIILSHFFGVSREAMVRRLDELRLVRRTSRTWELLTSCFILACARSLAKRVSQTRSSPPCRAREWQFFRSTSRQS